MNRMEFSGQLMLTSGIVQLTFGVLLGWAVLAVHVRGTPVGPIRNAKKILQCHIDNLMMGGIQIALGAAFQSAALAPSLLVIAGSWLNPQLFLIHAMFGPGDALPKWQRALAIVSFVTITLGYLLFLPSALRIIWN